MSKAGLVLGIIAMVLSLIIPVWSQFVTIPCIAAGLLLSGSAFYQARKSGTHSGVAIASWVTNAIALVLINPAFITFTWVLSGWDT